MSSNCCQKVGRPNQISDQTKKPRIASCVETSQSRPFITIVDRLIVLPLTRGNPLLSGTPLLSGNPLLSGTPYCPEPLNVRNPLLSGTPYCPEPPTVRNPLLPGTPYCPKPPTVRNPPTVQNSLLSGTHYCLEPPTVRKPLLSGTPSQTSHSKMCGSRSINVQCVDHNWNSENSNLVSLNSEHTAPQ